jgi:hypothetical protein
MKQHHRSEQGIHCFVGKEKQSRYTAARAAVGPLSVEADVALRIGETTASDPP